MPFLRGLLFRVGLGTLPLLVVILLCFLMMGWPLRNQQSNATLIRPPGLAAQAAIVPPSERVALPAQTDEPPAIAKFQSQHIEHAIIRVPH